MGDPAGIGPEVILKAILKGRWHEKSIPLVVGDKGVMDYYSSLLELKAEIIVTDESSISRLSPLSEGAYLLPLTEMEASSFAPGESTPRCGEVVVKYVKKAAQLAIEGKIAAMVTAPLSKASVHAAGYKYPGHTELLAELTGTTDFAMMLVGDGLRVSLVTIHVPLREVSCLLSEEEVYRVARLTSLSLIEWFGLKNPKVAIAAFNPHAGEEGAFGDEESRVISPAIERLKEEGHPVIGPYPADTLFYRAVRGEFDAVVAMYHDQGLIPIKLHAFDRGVNLTLGLPIIRTSVDHGTAFDIAGKGVASPESLISAYNLALSLANRRMGHGGF